MEEGQHVKYITLSETEEIKDEMKIIYNMRE